MARATGNRANRPNARLSLEPKLDAEYMDMLKDYKRDERKRRRLESPPPATTTHIKSEAQTSRSESPTDASSEKNNTAGPGLGSMPASTFGMEVDSESDSDFDEFEDVELDDSGADPDVDQGSHESTHQDVTISLDESQARNLTRKRREKGLPRTTRIAIHKTALVVWMVHTRVRSLWLSSMEVRNSSALKNVFTHQVLRELYPPEHLTDFLKSKRLVSGVKAAVEQWKLRFGVVRSGLASTDEDRGDPAQRDQFLNDLFSLRGSTDLLCQGFFAVMRSLGFRARLVCSLQPPDNLGSTTGPSIKTAKSESPIFWTEIWDPWAPGWISADPLTGTVRTPIGNRTGTAIEPKASDHLNILRYCIAWQHGQARDVTRRYASHYNARTRKKRLPHFEGEEWLDRLLAYFGPTKYTRADLAEIRELVKYTRREGIPKRVQDFVGHPQYALSNQLHHNELLRPGATPCGTLANRGKQQPVLYIYQRQDVLDAHSAQSWYRKGRAIKPGAQAVLRRETKNRLTGEPESVGLYTAEQTELYVPPPVGEDGIVPKSQYRTIDIFADSMVPRGAVYVRDALAVEAARILRIDYANAVTNIEFGKRGPQSKAFGVVVAQENEASMQLVLQGLYEQQREDAVQRENARILALWRQYIVGIQIWDRVEQMNPATSSTRGDAAGDAEHVKDEPQSDSSFSSAVSESSDVSDFGDTEDAPPVAVPTTAQRPQAKGRAQPTDSTPQARRKSTIRINEFGDDRRPSATKSPDRAGHAKSGAAWRPRDAASSPESHSSFSDLDVDEISESELL